MCSRPKLFQACCHSYTQLLFLLYNVLYQAGLLGNNLSQNFIVGVTSSIHENARKSVVHLHDGLLAHIAKPFNSVWLVLKPMSVVSKVFGAWHGFCYHALIKLSEVGFPIGSLRDRNGTSEYGGWDSFSNSNASVTVCRWTTYMIWINIAGNVYTQLWLARPATAYIQKVTMTNLHQGSVQVYHVLVDGFLSLNSGRACITSADTLPGDVQVYIEQRDIGFSVGLHCWVFTLTNVFQFFIFLVRLCFAQHTLVAMAVCNKQWRFSSKHIHNNLPKVTFYLRNPLLLPCGLSFCDLATESYVQHGTILWHIAWPVTVFEHDTVEWGQYGLHSILCFMIFYSTLCIRNGTLEICCWLIAWSPDFGLASDFDFAIHVQL